MIVPEIKRILYATDFTDHADHVFGHCASLADHVGAKITVLHVIESSTDYTFDLSAYLSEEKWSEIRRSQEQEARDYVDQRLKRFRSEARRADGSLELEIEDVVVTAGNPADEIVQRTENGDFDLVVMGSHGHRTLAETFIGSTVRRVVRRSTTPVLVVRLQD